MKRIFTSILWLLPVMAALNLVLYLFLGFTLKEPERIGFYRHLSGVVQICNLIIWFNLCRAGMLPGTGEVSGKRERQKGTIHDQRLQKMEKALLDTTYEDRAKKIIERSLDDY